MNSARPCNSVVVLFCGGLLASALGAMSVASGSGVMAEHASGMADGSVIAMMATPGENCPWPVRGAGMTGPIATFSVRNFEKFQHYKDRSPPWIKLYNELLDDYEFGLLQDASKFHLLAIWLLASRSENKIPYDPTWVARRINASCDVDLAELVAGGFIVLDQPLPIAEHFDSTPQAERLSREEGQVEDIVKDIEQQNLAHPSDDASSKNPKQIVVSAKRNQRSLDGFEEFWSLCPLKKSKAAAQKAWPKAVAAGATPAEIIAGMRRYAGERAGQDPRYTKHPSTWLNAGCWADESAPSVLHHGQNGSRANSGLTDFLIGKHLEQSNDGPAIDLEDDQFARH